MPDPIVVPAIVLAALPIGGVADAVLDRWDYRADESLDFTARDRSSIYGGVHLYVLKG